MRITLLLPNRPLTAAEAEAFQDQLHKAGLFRAQVEQRTDSRVPQPWILIDGEIPDSA